MNILSPILSYKEVKPLVDAGADEFYCGILSEQWEKQYTRVGSQNKRYWEHNQFRTFEDLEKAINIAHFYKKPVYVTVNAQFYTKRQYPILLEEIKKMIDIGADALIIADPALLLSIKKQKPDTNLHASSISAVFNSSAALFYKKLGASRIILPRQVTIKDISLISKSKIAFEAFILNERCWNIDGLCTFHHGISCKDGHKRDGCSLDYNLKIISNNCSKLNAIKYNRRIKKNILLRKNLSCSNECGICSLYYFRKYGVTSVKIVGRGHPLQLKLKYVSFVKNALINLQSSSSFEDYQDICRKQYLSAFNASCSTFSCYYPELAKY